MGTSRLPLDLVQFPSLLVPQTNFSATLRVYTAVAAAVVLTTLWLPLVMVTTAQLEKSMPSSGTPGAKAGEKVVTPELRSARMTPTVDCACCTHTQVTPYHH